MPLNIAAGATESYPCLYLRIMLKNLIFFLIFSFAFVSLSQAKEYRGIKPLYSNKEDVVRFLGKPTKEYDGRYYYKLENEEVIVRFSNGECDDFGFSWNAPSGNVLSIGVLPIKRFPLAELKINEKDFKTFPSGRHLGFDYLQNEQEGFEIETFDNFVTALKYEPEQKDSDKRCPQKRECCIDFQPQDRWQQTFKDKEMMLARLDNSAVNFLKESDVSRMYVIVAGKNEARAKQTAIFAKNHLVKRRKLNPNHVIAGSGKYDSTGMFSKNIQNEEVTIWIMPIGGIFSFAPYAAESIKAIFDESSAIPDIKKAKKSKRKSGTTPKRKSKLKTPK